MKTQSALTSCQPAAADVARRRPRSRTSEETPGGVAPVGGEERADVAEVGRAEQRVDQRVGDHVAVGVAGEPARRSRRAPRRGRAERPPRARAHRRRGRSGSPSPVKPPSIAPPGRGRGMSTRLPRPIVPASGTSARTRVDSAPISALPVTRAAPGAPAALEDGHGLVACRTRVRDGAVEVAADVGRHVRVRGKRDRRSDRASPPPGTAPRPACAARRSRSRARRRRGGGYSIAARGRVAEDLGEVGVREHVDVAGARRARPARRSSGARPRRPRVPPRSPAPGRPPSPSIQCTEPSR